MQGPRRGFDAGLAALDQLEWAVAYPLFELNGLTYLEQERVMVSLDPHLLEGP
jgi:hypothetical protein